MSLTKCDKGHMFDAEKNGNNCPYCNISVSKKNEDSDKTKPIVEAISTKEVLQVLKNSKVEEDVKVVKEPDDFSNKGLKKNKGFYIKRIAMVIIPVLMIAIVLFGYKVSADGKTERLKKEVSANLINHEKKGDDLVKSGSFDKALIEYKSAEDIAKKIADLDKAKQNELDKKLNITELVIDGDTSFISKEYDKAAENYGDAKKKTLEAKNYDVKELDKKIENTQSYLNVLQIEKQGDASVVAKNFVNAKVLFEQAKTYADKISFQVASDEIKSKIDEATSKINDLDKNAKSVQGKDLESQGDDSYTAQKFEDAKKYYESAEQINQELNNLEVVTRIQTKLKNLADMLSATAASASASAPAPTRTNAPASATPTPKPVMTPAPAPTTPTPPPVNKIN